MDLGSLGPIGVFFGIVVGAYGFGTWLGKSAAFVLNAPIGLWGDYFGILLGSVGFLFFLGYIVGGVLS